MHRLARADSLGLAELLQFRMLLEGSAYRLAAALRTDEQLAEMDAAIENMRAAVEVSYAAFSAADVAFHDAVARASRNKLIQICTDVVRSIVLDLVSGKIAAAADRESLMRQSIGHHEEVLAAVRTGDGPLAARLSRQTMYDYYVGYVPAEERPALRALL
jgi:DNA-binding FadR family transcriptional regulator